MGVKDGTANGNDTSMAAERGTVMADKDLTITPLPLGLKVSIGRSEILGYQVERLFEHFMVCQNSCENCQRSTRQREERRAKEISDAKSATLKARYDFEEAVEMAERADKEFAILRAAIIDEEYISYPPEA